MKIILPYALLRKIISRDGSCGLPTCLAACVIIYVTSQVCSHMIVLASAWRGEETKTILQVVAIERVTLNTFRHS